MADFGGAGGSLPEWAINVGVVVGAAVGAVMLRLGFKAKPPLEHATLAGAIVDSSSIDKLTKAVEDLVDALKTIKREDATDDLAREIRELGEEVRGLARALKDSR